MVASKRGEMGEKLLERFATHLIEFPDSSRMGKAWAQKMKTKEKIVIAFRKIVTNHIITNCDKKVKLVCGHFLSLQRRLSDEELMLLNCGVGEDS